MGMSRRSIVVLVGFVACTLAAPPAEAVLWCRRKSGRVVLRERCRKRETVLAPEQIFGGLQGPAGAPGRPGPAGDPRILDTTGREVGVPLGLAFGGATLVRHPSLRVPTAFLLRPAGYVSFFPTFQLFHQSESCLDAPLVVPYLDPAVHFFPFAYVLGTVALVASEPAVPVTYVAEEKFDPVCRTGVTSRGLCCVPATGTAPLSRADEVDLFDLGFVPPFRLEAP
jgi:hypothetical protein